MFKTKKLYQAVCSTFTLTAIALLSACGGEGQDIGVADDSAPTVFSGVAIDGALARSTVYLDSNNNATRDPWEDYAFTDNDGYYSYNPKTRVDYCAESAPAAEKIYCLRSNRSFANVVVRVDGGYDLLTGEPFLGQMSRRVDVGDEVNTVDSVVSPLTTLVTDIDEADDRESVLRALRIQPDDLNVNYLDTNGEGAIDSSLLNKALKVHKSVTLMSDRLNDNYSELNDESGVMNDPSAQIYKFLARELVDNREAGVDDILNNQPALTRVLDRSEGAIRSLYESRELTLPQDMGNEENPSRFSRVVSLASSVPDIVDNLISPSSELSIQDAVGRARALETFVIKSVNEGSQNDASVDAAINFFTQEESATLVNALTTALASDTADVSTLSTIDFSGEGFDTPEEIQTAAQLPSGSSAFSSMVGKQFKVSDLDLGTANALKDIEMEFYFVGSEGGLSGSFTACAKYIDDALPDGTLGDGNTRGELVNGYWSMLGATNNNPNSYSLLLTLEFLGATYQAIMKTVGTTTIGDVQYHKLRFDNSGEYRVWHSREGIIETQTIPETTAECERRLPSRVNL